MYVLGVMSWLLILNIATKPKALSFPFKLNDFKNSLVGAVFFFTCLYSPDDLKKN